MNQAGQELLVRLLAICATLIGFIIFFFVMNHFAYKKAQKEVAAFEKAQQKSRLPEKSHKK